MQARYRYLLEGYTEADDHISFFIHDMASNQMLMIALEEFKVVLIAGDYDDAPSQIEVYRLESHENVDSDSAEDIIDKIRSEEDNSDD